MNILIRLTLIILILSVGSVFAQDMAVPAKLQAALFKKIFAFDKTLKAKSDYQITVLSGQGSADEIVSAFKGAGLNISAVSGDKVPDGASVVYIMPGVTSPSSECASKGVLSISGVTSYVEGGNVAIGLGVEDGKPKIIVHFKQLKSEGHEISADLLRIAKVIK